MVSRVIHGGRSASSLVELAFCATALEVRCNIFRWRLRCRFVRSAKISH